MQRHLLFRLNCIECEVDGFLCEPSLKGVRWSAEFTINFEWNEVWQPKWMGLYEEILLEISEFLDLSQIF